MNTAILPSEKPPFPTYVDSTMISCADSCEAKFLYEYCHKLASFGISPDLHAGGAFSRGIEVARNAIYKHNLSTEQSVILGARAMIEFWGDFTPPPKHPKTLNNMIGALDDYFRVYPPAEDPLKPLVNINNEPTIEFSFALPTNILHPITGEPIIYCGRLDMLALHDAGFICIVDEKTTKSLAFNLAEKFAMRGQFIGYCYAVQQAGYDVSHAIIRNIAILKTKYNHLEVLESYPQWQIDRWWQNTNARLARLVEAWKEWNWLYSYGDACTSYNGCQFLNPLCTSEDPAVYFSDYQTRTWNPLQKDPTWPEGGPQYEDLGTLEDLMK